MTRHTVGIDISKARLDAHVAPEGRTACLSNDPAEFRKLIAWMGPENSDASPTNPPDRGTAISKRRC